MTVSYEWDIEAVDENGDIQDHNHSDYLSNSGYVLDEIDEAGVELVLVRDNWNQCGQLTRSWAYIKSRKMPEFFIGSDGMTETKVPQKYIKEFNRWVDPPV